jgi:protein phosphatase
MALATVAEAFSQEPPRQDPESRLDRRRARQLLDTALHDANRRILQRAAATEGMRGMGTTFAGIVVRGRCVTIAHVGDSRVYRLREDELEPLTIDHSLACWLLSRYGRVDELVSERVAGVITRCLGTRDALEVDARADLALVGDRYLLTTDGVHAVLGDELVRAVLLAHDDEDACDALVRAANDRGGPDNATAVIVRVAS